ncbi:hypothetical protein [Ktedonobacter robiniae]|uniref:Uncharacterized protein n=1 Tax=Ktedonobacter robiniae TaxID=2778365 RepID=A0ABQ3V5M9_9CHLR|nr:hypothetical protein [Ktedonobacter robiniae]GHO60180.1 hypothetical protein KSB_86550 [Ktedonobacter robiniae]
MAHFYSLVPAPGLIDPIEEPQIAPTENDYLALKQGYLSVDPNPGPPLVESWH